MLGSLAKSDNREKCTAISVDGARVAVASVSGGDGRPSVRVACHELPVDRSATAAIDLREFKPKDGRVVSVLERSDYQIQLIEAPNVPDDELRQAVSWRLKDLIDTPVEDMALDLFRLPTSTNASAREVLNAVVAKKIDVQSSTRFAESAGLLGVERVDIPELALLNIATRLSTDTRGTAFLHFSEDDGFLIIARRGVLHVVRQIPMGRRVFIENADDEFFINERVSGIALEVQRSLDFYESQYDYPPIDHLTITPGRGLAALPAALARETGLRVVSLDLHELFEIDKAVSDEQIGDCLVAIGAALPPVDTETTQSINLMELGKRLNVSEFPARFLAKAAAVLLLMMGGLVAWAQFEVSSLDHDIEVSKRLEADAVRRLAEVRETLLSVSGHQSWEEQVEALLNELQERQALLMLVQGSSLGETRGFSQKLRALARNGVDGMWLTYFSLGANGDGTRLEGQTIRAELVPAYLQNLLTSGPFSTQRFHQFEISKPDDDGLLEFSLDSAEIGTDVRGGSK